MEGNLTTEQALKKIKENYNTNKWNLLYNWINQGIMSAKVFRNVIKKIHESEVEQNLKRLQREYEERETS